MLSLFRRLPQARAIEAPLRFHNTFTNTSEDFVPLKSGEVKMYNCGPTVYGVQHIGNMRAAVFADVLRRTLEAWGYNVRQVINITDFGHLTSDADEGDDKMTVGLRQAGMELTLENMRQLAERYTEEYFTDIESLGVARDRITFPRASAYIEEQIHLIKTLEEKGYAYPTVHGVYYDVSRFPAYGKLGNIALSGLREGARVKDHGEKRGPFDFILWKSDAHLGWESPWGLGFPGWHIECTAMIFTLLGKQIDIHTGGIEHIPVHHQNEIAQAEAASGKQFVRYWLHNDHITIEGKKIAKSLGNTVYVHNIIDRGINPLSLRYWFLTAHYRSPANFTWSALEGAETALKRLSRLYVEYKTAHKDAGDPQALSAFLDRFYETLGNDLDTPKALALVWDMTKDAALTATQKYEALEIIDRVFALGFSEERVATKLVVVEESELPEYIAALVESREGARSEKNFAEADRLRDEIQSLGYELHDTPNGPIITKK